MVRTVHVTTSGAFSREDGLRDHAEHRVQRALARFGHAIRRANVHVFDVNGPRGGVDKRVRLTVTSDRFGSVHVHEDGADVRATLDTGLKRLTHTVARTLERTREPVRRRRASV